jgi:hypothetical protein
MAESNFVDYVKIYYRSGCAPNGCPNGVRRRNVRNGGKCTLRPNESVQRAHRSPPTSPGWLATNQGAIFPSCHSRLRWQGTASPSPPSGNRLCGKLHTPRRPPRRPPRICRDRWPPPHLADGCRMHRPSLAGRPPICATPCFANRRARRPRHDAPGHILI